MQLHIASQERELLKLQVSGDITQLDFRLENDPLKDLLGPSGYTGKVLLDLGTARMIDSRGVSWLLYCHRRFNEAGGKLILHSIPPVIDGVLQLLKMPLILKMAHDEMAAERLAAGASP